VRAPSGLRNKLLSINLYSRKLLFLQLDTIPEAFTPWRTLQHFSLPRRRRRHSSSMPIWWMLPQSPRRFMCTLSSRRLCLQFFCGGPPRNKTSSCLSDAADVSSGRRLLSVERASSHYASLKLVPLLFLSLPYHSDAPALSTTTFETFVDGAEVVGGEDTGGDGSSAMASAPMQPLSEEQWDDEAIMVAMPKTPAVVTPHVTSGAAAAEVLDMKSLATHPKETESIAEKLRVEATRAQLAAAREGMEREAAKIKEEKERAAAAAAAKQQTAAANSAPRFGAAAASVGGGSASGTKWVAPHLRAAAAGAAGGAGGLSRMRMGGAGGSGMPQKLDTNNEELFPDLASADKILEEKEKNQQVLFRPPKKTPVGGGATWATASSASSAKKTPAKPPMKRVEQEEETPPPQKEEVPKEGALPTEKEAPEPDSTPVASPPAAAAAPPVIIPKKTLTKKKKRDTSSFKPSGS
jgi:hypothetical protein